MDREITGIKMHVGHSGTFAGDLTISQKKHKGVEFKEEVNGVVISHPSLEGDIKISNANITHVFYGKSKAETKPKKA